MFGIAGNVAYWAHIGGFIAGMVLVPFLKRRKRKPLFLESL
ncbi:MAG: rhomboid family intramembrane serine protease [Thermoproteota archaeon]|nr:rhomboid family intramembrane serine protease [Thermoproteota archaeon]